MGLPNPILRFSDGSKIVDILAPNSGWRMADPYWNPQIAQYKRGGFKINPSIAEGQRLVHKEYDNVVETIPLAAHGPDQNLTIATINELLSLSRQAADFWAESYEFDDVWMEVAPPCEGALIGYARVVQMRIPELINPFGQPFFSSFNEAVMEGISLIVEREPLWRAVPPGEIIGPLYNVLKNPDFELWNFGITDSQPDSWSDLETIQITGQNSQQSIAPHSGNYALKVAVTGSTATGRFKGVTQILPDTRDNTLYTVVAWVRSDGVSNGVGRILVTYASQLEVYRSSTMHGWTLYTGTFTTGNNDIVAINCEILTTAANTVGTVYFDSIMVLEGDFEEYAQLGVLPYMSSSAIVNHWDVPGGNIVEAGDINYIDVWDMPGNADALVRIEFLNNTAITVFTNPAEVVAKLRIGMRRAGDVFLFQNFQDPSGPNDTTASSDSRINSGTLSTTGWGVVSTFNIQTPTITRENQGRFRAFARVFDTRTSGLLTLLARLRYWVGVGGFSIKTLDAQTAPILNNWCIVDLTPNAGVNWDTKGNADVPSNFGFDVQMMRSANTDQAYLDYVLLLPTDGGCLIADISPPIQFGQALIVDATAQNTSVGGQWILSEWQQVASAANMTNIEWMRNFGNALFLVSLAGRLFKYENNAITQPTTGIQQAIAVYGNRLYTFIVGAPSTGYSSDGLTFPGTADFTFGFTSAFGARAFGGKLYIAGRDAGVTTARLLEWNGSAATATVLVEDATVTSFNDVFLYQNKLYVGGTSAGVVKLYVYDPATGAYALSLNTGIGGNDRVRFVEFQNKLYQVANNATGGINVFDGNTWTNQTPFSALNPGWGDLAVIDDTLFVIGTDTAAAPDAAVIIKTTDGTNWEIDYNPVASAAQAGRQLAVSQGQLFANVSFSATGNIYAKTLTPNEFKVADYQLIPFYSPPKKRHRFFFNWDRSNDINNIDDKALVGLGFVPRYLALRGNR